MRNNAIYFKRRSPEIKEANLLWELSLSCFLEIGIGSLRRQRDTCVGLHCCGQCYDGNLGKAAWVHCLDLWNQMRLTGRYRAEKRGHAVEVTFRG